LSHSASADRAEDDKLRNDKARQIAPDVAYRQIAIVNVVFFGRPGAGDGNWILIDTGMLGSASDLRSAAQARFSGAGRPGAIVLTHGHFDHVGPLETLAEEWDVPVYAHALEHCYLNGTESYPPPDSTVGGGLMSLLSPLYPRKPVDVGESAFQTMPEDRWRFQAAACCSLLR
jgi:glyoxylase-like metal-dependent hydrolase (beta-lactamase superfamily II)